MFLRKKWYFCYLPPEGINKYKVYAYKIRVMDPGAHMLTFGRLEDGLSKRITVTQATKSLLTEEEYIKFAKANGFYCSERTDSNLSFCRHK